MSAKMSRTFTTTSTTSNLSKDIRGLFSPLFLLTLYELYKLLMPFPHLFFSLLAFADLFYRLDTPA